jgi:putative oxidoreductase
MQEDLGRLVLRLTVGILMLLIGVHKLMFGLEPLPALFMGVGLPGQTAYLAYVGMIVAPLLVILGVFARVGAALMAATMVIAVGLADYPHIFEIGKHGNYALELQAFYLFSSVAVALLGAGRFAVSGPSNWN